MDLQWYGVKCLIEHYGLSEEPGAHVYEERIVVVRAPDFDEAIRRAELAVTAYAQEIGARYMEYCNAYKMVAPTIEDGTEVYSVMREGPLSDDEFITRYYDDGTDKHH